MSFSFEMLSDLYVNDTTCNYNVFKEISSGETQNKTNKNRKTVKMNHLQMSSLKHDNVPKDEITNELPPAKNDIEQQRVLWDRFLEETRHSSKIIEEKETGYIENIANEDCEPKESNFEFSKERKSEENGALENIYTTHKALIEASKMKQRKISKQSKSSKSSILAKKFPKSKKKKPTVLEECRKDWDIFKKEEGINEDLAFYNKGRAGYLEKQAFLYRCDWRSFEYERNARHFRLKKDESSV